MHRRRGRLSNLINETLSAALSPIKGKLVISRGQHVEGAAGTKTGVGALVLGDSADQMRVRPVLGSRPDNDDRALDHGLAPRFPLEGDCNTTITEIVLVDFEVGNLVSSLCGQIGSDGLGEVARNFENFIAIESVVRWRAP